MSDPFWATNLEILFQQDKLQSFFPITSNTMVENLNAIVRLLIYLSIVMILYSRNAQYILLSLAGMLVTYCIFKLYPNKEELFFHQPVAPCERTLRDKIYSKARRIKSRQKKCVKPTVDNPFMNFNYITDKYHRPPACKAFLYEDEKSTKLKEKITDKFNDKLYQDVSDIYNKRNGQREFYTIGYNGIPDQTAFAKWLYGQSATCKENGLKCAPYTGSTL